MMPRWSICLAAAMLASCAAPPRPPPSGPPACFVTVAPPDAGEMIEAGAKMLVHPRAVALGDRPSGCQAVWLDIGAGPKFIGRFWYDHGRYIAYSAPIADGSEATLCRYRDGRLTEGNPSDCDTTEVRPMPSMAPGCFAVVRHSRLVGQPVPARCAAME